MNIVLIGPIGAGKSTVAPLLGDRLGRRVIAIDEVRWGYYSEIGYDAEMARRLAETGGFRAMYDYWKRFEIHAVERVVADVDDAVIEFGAGHSVYEDPQMLGRASRALNSQAVVLLLPDADVERTVSILDERLGADAAGDVRAINRHFVTHPSNETLARHTVYTDGRSPDDTCDDVIAALRAAAAQTG